MSYANMVLYGAVLPTYDGGKDKKKDGAVIDADDPQSRAAYERTLERAIMGLE